ncbi:MAG: UDP-N-acetylmuramate--L-alanine ligase [Campylobacteraceae bacterium]|nr:UDP-N-acetylmuramate--L-alanine ligase [Campylobacteraceae bacterium]
MKVHFVGIGGIGLSAIARFLLAKGHQITGSDVKNTKITEDLENLGIKITVPHNRHAVEDQDLLIYSAAVKSTNPELKQARHKGVQVITRLEALKLVLSDKRVYSVCGAHGKSTTTAMLAEILGSSALIGAESKAIGANCRVVPGSELMVFEADESDGSFLNSNPYCAIVTNAEPEHMEYYDYDTEWFYECYREFLSKAKKRVINAEDEFLSSLDMEVVRLYPSKDIRNIRYELVDGEPTTFFELRDLGEFAVWGFGEHIALDASLAILAAMNELEVGEIRKNLKRFKGIKKRFDIIHKDEKIAIIDDYAHHPTEIEATIKSAKLYAKLGGYDKITAIWQPHKWSRTMDNLEHFITCFEGVDELIILPVWAVNEEPRELDFSATFARYNPILAQRVKREDGSVMIVSENSQKLINGGLVIGFGAGDITYQLRGHK